MISKRRPQVVNIHMAGGMGAVRAGMFLWLSRLRRIPIVTHLHFSPAALRTFKSRMTENAMIKTIAQSDVVVTVSKEMADYLQSRLPANKPLRFMPNCINLQEWATLKRSAKNGNDTQLLFAGKLHQQAEFTIHDGPIASTRRDDP